MDWKIQEEALEEAIEDNVRRETIIEESTDEAMISVGNDVQELKQVTENYK